MFSAEGYTGKNMGMTFCQKCLAANEIKNTCCSHCGSELISPNIPAYLDGDLAEFYDDEVSARLSFLERQVEHLNSKLREVLEINQYLVQGLFTNSFKASLLTGYFLRNQGRVQEAERCFHRSIHLNKRSVSANLFLGIMALEKQRWREAISFFEQGLAIESSSAAVHYMVGVAHYLSGKLGKALGALQAAVQLDPLFHPAYLLMANIAFKRGWKRKSQDYLGRVIPERKGTLKWPVTENGMGQLFFRQDENLLHQLGEDQSLVSYLLREISQGS